MGRYVVRRMLIMIPLLVGVTFLTFAIINLIPGSPYTELRSNPKVRPADIARLEEQLGLNRPWPERYVEWVGDLLRGDLGNSMQNQVPVWDRIWAVLPNTLLLTTTSLILALLIAVPLGVAAGARHRSAFDRFANVFGVALYAVPNAWLAIMLIVLFSLKFNEWGWPSLPAAGITSPRGGGGFWDRLQHLILPAITLASFEVGIWSTYIRSSMLEALQQDYVRTARAKGLRRRTVLYGHAFRNAFLPLVTLVGLSLPALFGGSILVEQVFAWNGLGLLTISAVQQRDYTLIMGTTLMFAALTMVANLLADLLYGVVDPRIRLE